jgi:ribosomal protein S18 acetylase RimI-like enzyme
MKTLPLNKDFIKKNWGVMNDIEEKSGLNPIWKIENFIEEFPKKWQLSRVLLDDNSIISGYAILSQKSPVCAHLHRIVIAPQKQGKGIGTSLLQLIIADLIPYYKFLTLKVEKEETKIFYSKMGFLPIFSCLNSSFMLRVINND